ncbi:hypothetical protein ACU3L3_07585 [Priestia endophytica]
MDKKTIYATKEDIEKLESSIKSYMDEVFNNALDEDDIKEIMVGSIKEQMSKPSKSKTKKWHLFWK